MKKGLFLKELTSEEDKKLFTELYENDETFKEWVDRHYELNVKVDKLEKHNPMSHSLEMELEALKKEKLKLKDLIWAKFNEYKKQKVAG
ncbi:MAG: dihydroxy-acid dehydratase [Gammaproteobacteria bacterium]|nr:MAG: dihydroxy-acid dehydratase [Gammaproteobacteria bacterium]